MENSTYIALSRMDAQQRAMSVVADNMSNASTVGYKRENVLFSDFLSHQHGSKQAEGADTESYTQDRATYRDFQQGDMQSTGNPLDLALGGEGYFQVRTANGVRLTRAGRFEEQQDGAVVDESGNALLDRDGQPIVIPQTDHRITISADGVISTETGEQGQIGIVTAQDDNRLQAEGSRLLRTDQPTTAVERPNIVQGMVEGSNVQMMTEVTKMMEIQRNFQFMAQFVDAEATRQKNAIDKIVQVSA
ncbi:flagellar basal-body rod protein FlgF [Gluconobacter sphaericus]|mgnify:FL=1|uniref:Flagellar basal-body rod protein FlgF n=1 Tax=Gluconobacter sphaericus NBRC 12467 TaxID=1307951 RepID=A0AA37WB69_9PROT|nr:flagellar basal-body rod protein FlgF [Gluconobacter sphaericus]MBF0886254.1 flagellar basal-body rod protein FlgF [Gluconobacter sphaericus]MBS1086268.1 flagellar basal-body rod protein FlgF [Gluconobacter sphaericus]MBS1097254.1 flagellar basal-body rod protein FlgF [Gluconobacter sphaericus]MBS1100266.1 flagellar basal-body rod protein FlgF [Gluconobacter sphaericus]QQX92000.1 flagellar basal-body rod protein FlgF [Gluconobacter sphaericus]